MKRILSVILCAILLLGVAIPVYAVNAEDATTDTTAPSESVPETTATPSTDETTVPDNTTVPESTPLKTTDQETTTPAHIDGCSDDCTEEDCTCPCHVAALYESVMACKTVDGITSALDSAPDLWLDSLTDEQWDAIDYRLYELDPINAVSVEVPVESDPVVESRVIFPTVSYTNVAPLGDPVVGGAK